jgi:hypothetical protein
VDTSAFVGTNRENAGNFRLLAAAKAIIEAGLMLLLLVGVKQNSIEPNNASARMRR